MVVSAQDGDDNKKAPDEVLAPPPAEEEQKQQTEPQRKEKCDCVGNIMQVQASLVLQLQTPASQLMTTTRIPTTLHVMDATTADTSKECLDRTWDVTGLRDLPTRFAISYHLTVNDRAGTNMKIGKGQLNTQTKK